MDGPQGRRRGRRDFRRGLHNRSGGGCPRQPDCGAPCGGNGYPQNKGGGENQFLAKTFRHQRDRRPQQPQFGRRNLRRWLGLRYAGGRKTGGGKRFSAASFSADARRGGKSARCILAGDCCALGCDTRQPGDGVGRRQPSGRLADAGNMGGAEGEVLGGPLGCGTPGFDLECRAGEYFLQSAIGPRRQGE